MTEEKPAAQPKKDASPKPSPKKGLKMKGPRVFFLFAFSAVLLLCATWLIHNYIASPSGHILQKHFPTLFKFERVEPHAHKVQSTNQAIKNKPVKMPPVEETQPTEITLDGIDKRLDRMEGMISEAGSFEQDIDALKSTVQDLQEQFISLKVEMKGVELKLEQLPNEIKSEKLSKDAFKEVQDNVQTQLDAVHQRISDIDQAQARNAEIYMSTMLVIQTFNQVRQLLYAGAPWYFLLEDIKAQEALLPEAALHTISDLLDNLKPYRTKVVVPPAVLAEQFNEAVQLARKQSAASDNAATSGYWGKFKQAIGGVIKVHRTNEAALPAELDYVKSIKNALVQQRIAVALDILKNEQHIPREFAAWQQKAEMWVAIMAELENGEEALLKILLNSQNKG